MRAQPSYIRTIKPNQNRSATEYDTKAILHQIKYLGLEENIRVRRAGFAYRNTFDKMVERFYLLSPSTSYAGEYTWQGDAKSGCERILKDTGIAKDEWQMGVTKAFIKNPETVSALCNGIIIFEFIHGNSSSLPWKLCVTVIGIAWRPVFSELGEITGAIRMSVLDAFRGSGRITKNPLNMPKFETTVIRCWQGERNVDVTVSSAIAVLWATILILMARAPLALTCVRHVVWVVSYVLLSRGLVFSKQCSGAGHLQLESADFSVHSWSVQHLQPSFPCRGTYKLPVHYCLALSDMRHDRLRRLCISQKLPRRMVRYKPHWNARSP